MTEQRPLSRAEFVDLLFNGGQFVAGYVMPALAVVDAFRKKPGPLSVGALMRLNQACGSVDALATATRTAGATTANPETSKPLFPEELQQTLEYWMVKQDYDHKFLEPLEEYAKNLYETSTNRGWIEVENDPSLAIWIGESKSPELLQESHAVFFKVDNELRGFLWNDDGTYSLQGEGEDMVEGTMTHFSGEVEGNYEGSFENQIPIDSLAPFDFLMVWKGPNKWQGLIDFRGQTRPYGGGKDQDSFPTGGLKWPGKWPGH